MKVKKMKKWNFCLGINFSVEARTEDEAWEKAEKYEPEFLGLVSLDF